MTKNSMLAGVLGATLMLAGCGDRNAQTGQNSQENAVVPPPAESQPPAPAVPPPAPAATPAPPSPQADNRLVEPRRPAPARRSSAPAPRPDETQRPSVPAAVPETAARPAPAPPAPEFREVTVSTGTALPLELTTALSSETAQVETPVRARLRQPIVVNGYTALPSGTVLTGFVTDVERSGRVQGRARITFSFTEATVAGSRQNLRSDPLTFEAEATKGEDATKVGAGAGVGAVIGGILGGGKGAATGAAIGGAAGTGAVLATRGKEVELAVGREINARLASPLTVQVPLNGR